VPVLPTVPGQEGVLPLAENSFEGSYVAVSGRPGQRTVHVVNGRGGGNFAGTGNLQLKIFKNVDLHDFVFFCSRWS
jgi:hypothetical protein